MMTKFFLRLCSLIPAAIAAGTVAPSAAGQLLVNESFLYANGTPVRDQAGGIGFSWPWLEVGIDLDTVRDLGLSYPNLGTAGHCLHSRAPIQYYTDVSRSLGTPISGATGTVLWVSFLLRKDTEGSIPPPGNYLGLALYPTDQSNSALYIGDTGESDFYSIAIAGSAEGQVASNVPSVVSPNATLLLVRIMYQDGPDVIDLFVNPNLAAGEPMVASATKNDFDLTEVNLIGLLAGNDTNWVVDEIRLGNSFADVTPRPVVLTAIDHASVQPLIVQGAGASGTTYTLQVTDELVQPFAPLTSAPADVNGDVTFEDPAAPGLPKRFYRIVFP